MFSWRLKIIPEQVMLRIMCTGNGLILEINDLKVAIDRVNFGSYDFHFITHAHTDHLPRQIRGKLITSQETKELIKVRNKGVKENLHEVSFLEPVNSGHILGSRALLVKENKLLYTSDVNPRDRLFMKGFKPIQVDTLIIEGTYGKKNFVFGETGKLIDEILSYTFKLLSEGRNIVALGYSLGKGQILTRLFSWCSDLIVDNEVAHFNEVYERFGVYLGKYLRYTEASREGLFKEGPWVFVTHREGLAKRIAKQYEAKIIRFTGWVCQSRNKRQSREIYGFPLSDHADFCDLVNIVRETQPSRVYIAYGFSNELAAYLRELGFDAHLLPRNQKIEL